MERSPPAATRAGAALSVVLLAALTACIPAGSSIERAPELASIEPARGCDLLSAEAPKSTFVLFDPVGGRWLACNATRAFTSYLPASTFKVPHALIALETGVVEDPLAAVAWDGIQRRVAAWNQDTSLASGMENSTVWFYQRTARSVGHARMSGWVSRLEYGNGQIGPSADLTHFWLDGELRISAIQQVMFLNRLRLGALPASRDSQARVAEMMRDEETFAPWSAYRKTGAVLPIDPDTGDINSAAPADGRLDNVQRVGWMVGWISRPKHAGGDRVFAFNLELHSAADLGKRKSLAHALLRANGVGE